MKKITKFLSIVLICFSTTFIFNLSAISVKADTVPVQLCYANYVNDYSGVAGHVYGYVTVRSSSADKDVIIHYSYTNSNSWKDIAATYVKTDSDGNEIWKFQLPSEYFRNCLICVKCVMNGQTYWDNNGGQNYLVNNSTDAFGKNPVALFTSSYTPTLNNDGISDFSGKIVLKNIAYQKEVIVKYTTDDWKTYNEAKATHSVTSNNKTTELWDFSINLEQPAQSVKYAILYKVNGQEYWDNNFGSNYDAIADKVHH